MSDGRVPHTSTPNPPTQPPGGGVPEGFTSGWAPRLVPMSQGETGNEQDPRAGQSHAAMPQASSANQDSVPPADEDPYADLFGDARGDTPAQGSALRVGVGDLGGFTSDNRATPVLGATQAESEVSTRLAQYPPGVRAPSPGWFNPHPPRARGETGPIPGAPRPESEGSIAPAVELRIPLEVTLWWKHLLR